MTATTTAYPLQWPAGRERIAHWRRESAQFDTSMAAARDGLLREVRLLGGRNAVLSTNVPLRQDGKPYASFARIDDPAVAVYFTYRDRQMCFACDRWKTVEDNLQAVRKTIEALRGIARWGTGDMLAAAFTGFAALPPPTHCAVVTRSWREVLEYGEGPAAYGRVQTHYRIRAMLVHPDRGGTETAMAELNKAREEALQEVGT